MKTVIQIPGLPPITQTEENRFEFGVYWFSTLPVAIVFAIGTANNRPDDFIRSAVYLLGVSSD